MSKGTGLRQSLWLVFTVALAGCGSGSPFDIVKVQGDVLYEDGSPLPAGTYQVRFVPQFGSPDGKNFGRVATGEVDESGKLISVTTRRYDDGLIKGKYAVCLTLEGKKSQLAPESCLNDKTTPLSVDVAESRKLEIRVPKP